jgi:hypothetical protein
MLFSYIFNRFNSKRSILLILFSNSDGASYAFATLTLEEKDPQLQDLTDVNPGPNNG